jgi:hypothetical protein
MLDRLPLIRIQRHQVLALRPVPVIALQVSESTLLPVVPLVEAA